MKRLLKRLFRFLLFALVIIGGIMTVNTMRFSSKQIKVEPVEKITVSDEVVERISEAIKIPTVSTYTSVDTAAFRDLDTFIVDNFPLVDSLLDKEVISQFGYIFKWQGKNPKLNPILLMGHTDVVPVEESSISDWDYHPFSGAIEEGFIWGRGTLDDKASVICILESVESMLREEFDPNRTIYLAFGHDEEVLGENGAQKIASYFAKQKIEFEFVLDEGGLIMNSAMPDLDRPVAMIGVAEKGYTTLTLTAQLPQGGHSSMPPPETAVGMLAKAISDLEANPFPSKIDGAVKGMLEYIGPEMGTVTKSLFANLWLTEGLLKNAFEQDPGTNAMIRTTIAPTMLRGGFKENVLPTSASGKVNFRILPGETVESVVAYVRKTIDNPRIVVQAAENGDNPSPVSSTDSYGFQIIQRTVLELNPDIVVAPSLVVGATDARFFTGLSDHVYRFTPYCLDRVDTKRFHGLNERLSTEEYKNMHRFYRRLILNASE